MTFVLEPRALILVGVWRPKPKSSSRTEKRSICMQATVCQIKDPRWDPYVSAHAAGTFFHKWNWREIISTSFGYEPLYLRVEENGEIQGVLPLFLVRSLLFGRSLVALPLAVYGGPLANSPIGEAMLLEKAMDLGRQHRAKYLELRGNPHSQAMLSDISNIAIPKKQKDLYVTFMGEIDSSDDVNLSRIPRKQRRMVRQGEKHGLRFVLNNDRLPEFYEIYAASVRNLGTPVYGYPYFENIVESFGDRCKVFLVDYQGKTIAGALVFFYKDQVMPYYGGAFTADFSFVTS